MKGVLFMTEKQKSTIAQMCASGMAVKDIATQLDLSPETVKSYLTRNGEILSQPLPPVRARTLPRRCRPRMQTVRSGV